MQRLDRLAPVAAVLGVDAKRAATMRLEDLQVTPRLRREQRSEGERQPRDGQVLSAVAGDLQEEAGVRSTLVQLPGGVEEARTESHGAGEPGGVPDFALDA